MILYSRANLPRFLFIIFCVKRGQNESYKKVLLTDAIKAYKG